MPIETARIRHGRIELALHSRTGRTSGPPLLLLHALRAASHPDLERVDWSGPVHALDLAGHGASGWLRGGGYTPELFAADADTALAHLGDEAHDVCVAGWGLGAYVALLLAGARPEHVAAALLMPGEGLGRGDGEPDFERRPLRWAPLEPATDETTCDPALARLNDEFKPSDYVRSFAERARRIFLVGDGAPTPAALPGWWHVAAEAPHAEPLGADFSDALRHVAAHMALDA